MRGCPWIQEFEGGGKLYIGGIESATEASAGRNTAGISAMVDCRGSDWTKDGEEHHIEYPDDMQHCVIVVNSLAARGREDKASARVSFGRVIRWLSKGEQVLVFCKNGRHRTPNAAIMQLALLNHLS